MGVFSSDAGNIYCTTVADFAQVIPVAMVTTWWLQTIIFFLFLTCTVLFLFLQSKSSFFSKFCNLPFAARVAIFVLVVLIGLGTFGCCLYVCCCKPPAQGKKIDLKDFDDKFSYDGEFEAPALEHKVPIEKQKLVIDAWELSKE